MKLVSERGATGTIVLGKMVWLSLSLSLSFHWNEEVAVVLQ
nr:hypothetical protein [Halomonas sp.]